MRTLLALHPPIIMFSGSIIAVKFVSVFFLLTVVLMLMDVWGRYKDWINIRNKPKDWFTIRRMKLLGKTWCGRTIVKTAYPKSKIFYKALGYKYYHVFPDKFLTLCFKPKFYLNLSKGYKL